jgi:hypothetical protein
VVGCWSQEGETFRTFLNKSSHIVNRALGLSSAVDILKDYTGADKSKIDADDRSAVMTNSRTFTNTAVNNRPIMDVQVPTSTSYHIYSPSIMLMNMCVFICQVNPHHPELFLVSYGSQNAKGAVDNSTQLGKSAEGKLSPLDASNIQQ